MTLLLFSVRWLVSVLLPRLASHVSIFPRLPWVSWYFSMSRTSHMAREHRCTNRGRWNKLFATNHRRRGSFVEPALLLRRSSGLGGCVRPLDTSRGAHYSSFELEVIIIFISLLREFIFHLKFFYFILLEEWNFLGFL